MDKENAALIIAALLLLSLFTYSLYIYLWPKERVWEVTVFDSYYIEKRDYTYVAGYDGGYLRLKGRYDLEVNATYRIRYISRRANWADEVLSIERIG